MLTQEDFTAIKEELAEDFTALADEQLVQVRQLIAQLDDDRLDAQIQFESYERTKLRQEKAKQAATINLSDEEPSPGQGPDEDKAGESQPEPNLTEQLAEDALPQPPVPGAGQTSSEQQSEQQSEKQPQPQPEHQQQQQPQQDVILQPQRSQWIDLTTSQIPLPPGWEQCLDLQVSPSIYLSLYFMHIFIQLNLLSS
mgnify:CR=1 FL=1